jgi:autotransporter-associated beta strand protein
VIQFTTAPAQFNGILAPWAVAEVDVSAPIAVREGHFLRYSTAVGAPTSLLLANYSPLTNINSATDTDVFNATASHNIPTSASVYALRVTGATLGGGMLNIGRPGEVAGLIMNGGTMNPNMTTFVGSEAAVYVGTGGGSVTITRSTTGGLTKFGPGTLTMSGLQSYSGPITILDGAIRLNTNGQLLSPPGGVTVVRQGVLSGVGQVGGITAGTALTIGSGGGFTTDGTLAPGDSPVTNSRLGQLTVSGMATFNGGARYRWELVAPTGTAGTHWDLLNAFAIQFGGGGPITIEIDSLSPTTANGPVPGFDLNQSYQWTIARVTNGGITGFDPAKFALDASGFMNSPNSSQFGIEVSGNDLVLTYTPVPEPATVLGLAAGALGAGWLRRRLRRGHC